MHLPTLIVVAPVAPVVVLVGQQPQRLEAPAQRNRNRKRYSSSGRQQLTCKSPIDEWRQTDTWPMLDLCARSDELAKRLASYLVALVQALDINKRARDN